jgi:hypothetical protein
MSNKEKEEEARLLQLAEEWYIDFSMERCLKQYSNQWCDETKRNTQEAEDVRRLYLRLCSSYIAIGRSELCQFFHELHKIEPCQNACPAACILSAVQKDALAVLPPQTQAALLIELEGHDQRNDLFFSLPDRNAQAQALMRLVPDWHRQDFLGSIDKDEVKAMSAAIHKLQVDSDLMKKYGWCVATYEFFKESDKSLVSCNACQEKYSAFATVRQMKCGKHTYDDGCTFRQLYWRSGEPFKSCSCRRLR